MEGILPAWKPAGLTSHDVVAKVRRLLGIKRIGHTGTLDPMVTGVLPLAIGRATRVVEYIQDLPKSYEAVIRFGIATDTEDLSGNVIQKTDRVEINKQELENTLQAFRGEIEQIPPMYSSVKKDGKRLYELARQGKIVERKPRKVTIYKLDIVNFTEQMQMPEATLKITCSKGTYIRTLCKDIGEHMEVPSVMAKLVRTASGPFTIDHCFTLEQIEKWQRSDVLQDKIVPIDQALQHFPAYTVPADDEKHALNGRKLPCSLPADTFSRVMIRAYTQNGQFIGVYNYDNNQKMLVPLKLFI